MKLVGFESSVANVTLSANNKKRVISIKSDPDDKATGYGVFENIIISDGLINTHGAGVHYSELEEDQGFIQNKRILYFKNTFIRYNKIVGDPAKYPKSDDKDIELMMIRARNANPKINPSGAGLYVSCDICNPVFHQSTVIENSIDFYAGVDEEQAVGAGIYFNAPYSIIVQSHIQRNEINDYGNWRASIAGAGLFSNSLTLINSSIIDNSLKINNPSRDKSAVMKALGAAIFLSDNPFINSEISNNTISGNQITNEAGVNLKNAYLIGGGIFMGNTEANLSYNTIVKNRAEYGGAMEALKDKAYTLRANIILDNEDLSGEGSCAYHKYESFLFNILSEDCEGLGNQETNSSNSDIIIGDEVNAVQEIVDLNKAGGVFVVPNSEIGYLDAVNDCLDVNGEIVEEDQLAQNRPIGPACDIGAFEFNEL